MSVISSTSGQVSSFNKLRETLSPAHLCARDCYFKTFLITTIFLAVVTVVIGVMAVVASSGQSITHVGLAKIGKVNGYVMIAGGVALAVLGLLAWGYHLKQAHGPPPPDVTKRKTAAPLPS